MEWTSHDPEDGPSVWLLPGMDVLGECPLSTNTAGKQVKVPSVGEGPPQQRFLRCIWMDECSDQMESHCRPTVSESCYSFSPLFVFCCGAILLYHLNGFFFCTIEKMLRTSSVSYKQNVNVILSHTVNANVKHLHLRFQQQYDI